MHQKLKAAGIHLFFSAVVVSVLATLMYCIIYTPVFFELMGTGKIFLLLAGVDVCLGPLITFTIYNATKKRLKTELAFVVVLQLAAMLYGASAMYAARPSYIVFADSGFVLIAANQLVPMSPTEKRLMWLPSRGPSLVGVRSPQGQAGQIQYFTDLLNSSVNPAQLPKYYVPYIQLNAAVQKSMTSVDILLKRSASEKKQKIKVLLDELAARNHLSVDDLAFVPMLNNGISFPAVLHRQDGRYLTVLPVPID